jgi:putative tricarboxylic transport membrane protein
MMIMVSGRLAANRLRMLLILACLVTSFGIAGSAPARAQGTACTIEWPSDALQIMAPAAPGGGWDSTAREIQRNLQEQELVSQSVEVFNVEGAAGTIGLAELVNDHTGNENMMMVMGLVMLGGIALNESPVNLDTVTPIARLTTEFEVIVVPADSEYQTLEDLMVAFEADPGAISWAGGSAGGTDNILVGLIAQARGIDPTLINYVPFSGGGEALAAILGGQTTAGVSGLSEWLPQIESGELRALAVSGRAAAPGSDGTPVPASAEASGTGMNIPTLQEQGVDVELANWRGIVAPPGISPEARDCQIAAMEALVASEGWKATLAAQGWTDYFLAGDEYATYLAEQRDTVNQTLTDLGLI